MKENKRYESTDLKIQEAFFRLLDFRHIDDIDIKSICKEANISRSTFYQHYQSIASLIDTIEEKIFTERNTSPIIKDPNTTNEEKMCAILEIVKKYRAYFFAFLTHNSPSIRMTKWMERIEKVYTEIVVKYLNADTYLTPQNVHTIKYAGTKSLITEWLSTGCEEEIPILSRKIVEASIGKEANEKTIWLNN